MNKKNLKESKIVFLYLTLALSPFFEGCGSDTEKNNVVGDQQTKEDYSFENNENFDNSYISSNFENEKTENEDEPDDSYEKESSEILIEKYQKEKQEIYEKYQKEKQEKERQQKQIESNKKLNKEEKEKLEQQLKEEIEKINYNISNCSVNEQQYLSSIGKSGEDLFSPVHNARKMLGLETPDNKQKIVELNYEVFDKQTITIKEIKNILKGSFTEKEIWTRNKIKEKNEKKEKYPFRFFCDDKGHDEYIEYKMGGEYLNGYDEKLNFVVDYVCKKHLMQKNETKRGMISISNFTRVLDSKNNPTEINFKNLEVYLTKEGGEQVKVTVN